MSTACSHLAGAPGPLLSGAAGGYSFADILEEAMGPARVLNDEGLDELFEAVEGLLREMGEEEDDGQGAEISGG